MKSEVGKRLVVSEPKLPVELLDASVPVVDDLVNGSESHVGSVLELEEEGDGRSFSLLEDGEGDETGGGREGEFDGFELVGVRTEGSSSTEEGDRGDFVVGGGDDLDSLVGTRSEESLHGVGDVSRSLDVVDRRENSSKPSDLGTGESLEPLVDGRKRRLVRSELVDGLSRLGRRDGDSGERGRADDGFGSDVVDRRDLGLVSTVVPIEELLGELGFDVSEDLSDGFVDDCRVSNGDGSLEDADSLRVSIEDGLDILGGPEGVLREEEEEEESQNEKSKGEGAKERKRRVAKLTFLNQTSKLESRTGMKGTGF